MQADTTKVRHEETIAAISTPSGESAIGIVRLSGATAVEIARQMFRAPSGKQRESFDSHKVYYGHVVDEGGAKIDETMVTVMLSPRTYTREDVVEISGHGGATAAKRILQRTLDLGARIADPGEFSKRAFLNGRIDLVQAEAIIDLISSKSEKGFKTAFSQLDGHLSIVLQEIEDGLIDIISAIEASIDFPDEELEIIDDSLLSEKLQKLQYKTSKLLDTYGVGRIYREGIGVAIVGRPNVGKSSLMNCLLERDRVIVTAQPGTTRDTVEETLQIEGVAVRIIDTAGVREAVDEAERMGAKRAVEAAREADIVLLILDGAERLSVDDINLIDELHSKDDPAGPTIIPVVNKSDKILRLEVGDVEKRTSHVVTRISAKNRTGIDNLRKRISAKIDKLGENLYEGPVLTRERHMEKLKEMSRSIECAIESVNKGMSREFVAADLQDAKEALGELTGKEIDEMALEKIFSEFCIGK
jgi:tRNA modification GTPase